jgi:hypothetical protein
VGVFFTPSLLGSSVLGGLIMAGLTIVARTAYTGIAVG